jgi:oligosaccharide reducing-end xylanase
MLTLHRLLFLLVIFSFGISACGVSPTPVLSTVKQTEPTETLVVAATEAFETGVYRNLFTEYLKKSDAETQAKLDAAWTQLFYGNDDTQRIYYPVSEDMAYIADIGNSDVRTEGMSYGMMIAVQLDKKAEFDRLWKWAKTYMYQSDGPYKGYFAWHCSYDGKKLASNPASDGEEWFVMALLFASVRWENGEGIYDYQAQAQEILNTMLHKHEQDNGIATDMFDSGTKQVVFVPSGSNSKFTDPSYHLPAYYELWARWAKQDKKFWTDAAQASRAFYRTSANPQTGLMPDYANFDGTPTSDDYHKDFRFDAWRTLSNVAVDYAWFAGDPWEVEQSNRVLDFLASQGMDTYGNQFSLDGKTLSYDHSTGLISTAAIAALAADPQKGQPFVQALWDARIPSGQWRYYDGMLYMLGLLHVSGNFRIYGPAE